MAQSRLRSLGEGDTNEFFTQGDPLAGTAIPPHNTLPPNPSPNFVENAATSILMTALKALSHRAVIAVANLFVLATAISAFCLWYVTMPAPTILQLVGLALYGVLIVCLNMLVLRRT